jgi:hypothetical protein
MALRKMSVKCSDYHWIAVQWGILNGWSWRGEESDKQEVISLLTVNALIVIIQYNQMNFAMFFTVCLLKITYKDPILHTLFLSQIQIKPFLIHSRWPFRISFVSRSVEGRPSCH